MGTAVSTTGLDSHFTFESFIAGNANRLAHAAALRVAASSTGAYNPLFIYGASGLGKTHLLMAIGNAALKRTAGIVVRYESAEPLLDRTTVSGADAERIAVRERLREADLVLLDDAQFLAGRLAAQEELMGIWDALSARGGQLVLAADRPPNEIEETDRRLLSRFMGGLVADLAPPDYDTRVQILERRARERGHTLEQGVADVLAKVAFSSVRELQGGLNRVLAVQELESRSVAPNEVLQLIGLTIGPKETPEFDTFLTELSGTMGEVLDRLSPEQHLADAILRYEGEGFWTKRLEAALSDPPSAEAAKALVRNYSRDVARLREARNRIEALDASAPELARDDILRDPDCVEQAEALAARVKERVALSDRVVDASPAPTESVQRSLEIGPIASESDLDASPEDGEHGPAPAIGPEVVDGWFLSREKVLWSWPYLDDWIVAELD